MTQFTARHGEAVHGKQTPEYFAWERMLQRCDCPTNNRYRWYGGRGIQVCTRWRKYENFLLDMGRRPSSEFSLGRVDNDGNYEPANCRWMTVQEQARNTQRSRYITAKGETLTHTEWSRRLGGEDSVVRNRIFHGWSELEAATTPLDKRYSRRRKA